MSSHIFRDNAIRVIRDAVSQAQQASRMDHLALRGKIRELAVDKLLRPCLPGDFALGTGKVVDSRDTLSAETDVLIYSSRILMPIMFSKRDGIFPVEATFAAVEVKSALTARELDDAIVKFRALRTLTFQAGHFDENDRPRNHQIRTIIPALFAFGSDLAGKKTEIARYAERDTDVATSPAIRFLCVVGKGYWRFHSKERQWYFRSASSDHDEVLDFLSGIANSLPTALQSRGNPRLGHYLMDGERHSKSVIR